MEALVRWGFFVRASYGFRALLLALFQLWGIWCFARGGVWWLVVRTLCLSEGRLSFRDRRTARKHGSAVRLSLHTHISESIPGSSTLPYTAPPPPPPPPPPQPKALAFLNPHSINARQQSSCCGVCLCRNGPTSFSAPEAPLPEKESR